MVAHGLLMKGLQRFGFGAPAVGCESPFVGVCHEPRLFSLHSHIKTNSNSDL